jgi:hypothetical protein
MTNERVTKGHLNRLWNDDFKHLPYKKQPVTKEEIDEWKQLGYDESNVKSFTGHMYDNRNPMPNWVSQIQDAFGLYKQTYTFYKMETLEIMPAHSDHYRTYCKINNVTYDEVYRVILMLEDWKPGHYFELDGVSYTNWKAGDWFKWRGNTPHAASNIGVENRYTLQITGISMFTGQLDKLLMFNIPDSVSTHSSHPLVRHSILPNIEKHSMVYMHNGFMKELNQIDHNLETVNLLNTEGLHIYLYEPLSCYINDEYNMGFYSDLESYIEPNELRASELDSITHYAIRNNLKNITVHTCDYNVDEWYKAYNFKLKLVCDDLFLKTQVRIQNLDNKPVNNFTKKFICLNWRYAKHREVVSNFLVNEDGHLSWYYNTNPEVFEPYKFHTEIYNKLIQGNKTLTKHGPYYVDKKAKTFSIGIWPNVDEFTDGTTPALYNGEQNTLEEYYNDVFVDIVNETRFYQPTGNFSEKVFQAIQYMKPFILVAPPHTLEYVKSFGFKTFDEFWNESYDNEIIHIDRMTKILEVVDKINNTPIEELRVLYKKMIPILEHNLEVYKRMVK